MELNNIMEFAQELHYQLFGQYIKDFQDSDAQIITCMLQEYGRHVAENLDKQILLELECDPTKIIMTSLERKKHDVELKPKNDHWGI